MANYQLDFWQNNEILNRISYNEIWHTISSGFVIELHVHRNNGVLRTTFYQENGVFLSRGGMREFLTRILFAEQIPVNLSTGGFLCDNGVQLVRQGPSGLILPIPVYTLEDLVLSVLDIVRSIRNRNRNLALVPIQLDLTIIQFRQPLFLDDSIVLDGESLEQGLPRLDDSMVLDGESMERRLPRLDDSIILDGALLEFSMRVADPVIKLKEEKVEVSTDCCICLESVDIGEIVARLPCSHLFHTTCITRWLHNKPLCPLCRAPAS